MPETWEHGRKNWIMLPRIFHRLKQTAASIRCTAALGCALALLMFFPGCQKTTVPPAPTALDRILEKKEITVITRNNAYCYYLYRDQPMGFEYDLARAFADSLGVRLNIQIADDRDGLLKALLNKKGDFVAASITIPQNRQNLAAFSDPYMTLRQHIVVHRETRDIRRTEDLAGQTVHVRRGSSYAERLAMLQRQGIDLRIKLSDSLTTEELIRLVAQQDIDVTLADSNIALLNRRYYPKAIVGYPVSEREHLGWAVHPEDADLLDRINRFFETIKKNGRFDELYNKYYAGIDNFDYVDLRTYHRRLKTRLPRYSQMIKKAAAEHDLDWRLIAAQVYQESHFNPHAKSHAGAYGLMQLTRSTADSMTIDNILDPAENILGGVRHLKKLYDFFDKADDPDRLFIALAAYNIGQGHILDARNLARKMALSPDKWASLKKTLPLLRYRKYYKNAIYGYCRGTEPVEYVKQIMVYYDILKRQGIEFNAEKRFMGARGAGKKGSAPAGRMGRGSDRYGAVKIPAALQIPDNPFFKIRAAASAQQAVAIPGNVDILQPHPHGFEYTREGLTRRLNVVQSAAVG